MNYATILKKAIQDSGLKLNKIKDLVQEKHDLNPSIFYLSRLQNGRVTPAGDRLNRALASVLGIDPLDLQVAAYREKIPKQVLERLTNTSA